MLTGHLESVGMLISTGRQGAFCYPDMHGAMRMGADAAGRLLEQFAAAETDDQAGAVAGKTAAG